MVSGRSATLAPNAMRNSRKGSRMANGVVPFGSRHFSVYDSTEPQTGDDRNEQKKDAMNFALE